MDCNMVGSEEKEILKGGKMVVVMKLSDKIPMLENSVRHAVLIDHRDQHS